MTRVIGRIFLRLFRYRVVGAPPTEPVSVVVAAPHTSNWDFPLMLSIAWVHGLSPAWLGKKEMFWGPLAPLYRKMGGIAVDRQNPAGLVDSLVARARSGRRLILVIPPEGTRSKKTYWKSGFRRIARDADIPIVLAFVGGPGRTCGFGPTIIPSADVQADMDQVRAFYADKGGVRPKCFTPPLLREEEQTVES